MRHTEITYKISGPNMSIQKNKKKLASLFFYLTTTNLSSVFTFTINSLTSFKQNKHFVVYRNYYYSLKIFPRLYHNQVLMTKFGRILRLMNR